MDGEYISINGIVREALTWIPFGSENLFPKASK